MKTSLRNTGFADPLAGFDTTKIEVEKEVIGDPWQWYLRESERILGRDRFLIHFNEMAEYSSFEEHLKTLPSETDIVLEAEDRDSFPIEYAPKFIRDLSDDLAKYSSVPVSIPFLSIVAMYSAALGKNLRVKSGASRTTPANLFATIFADSGSGKSDLFRKIATPLVDRNKSDRERFEKDVRPKLQGLLDIKVGKADEVKKTATGKVRSADLEERQNASDTYIQLQKEIAILKSKLRPPEYYAEDYTIEALGMILERSDEQIACISPEALKPIQNLKGLYKDGTVEDTIYNKAYSLEPGKIDRTNRESNQFNEPCIALLWMTQPDKISELFGSKGLVQGGFVPRCISLYEHTEAQEISWSSKSVNADLFDQYRRTWSDLFDGYRLGKVCAKDSDSDPFSDEGEEPQDMAQKPEIQAKIVTPAAGAADHMVNHYNRLVHRRNADMRDISMFVARWTENAWRLALVLHAVEHGTNAHNVPMSLQTAQGATRVMDWFARGQLDLIRRSARDEENDRVERLIEIVRAKGSSATKGVLKNNHGLDELEVREIVAASRGRLQIAEILPGPTGGRKSFNVELGG
jgi:hypothetical protein